MPVLTNPKHERFCQELAQGKTADEAYVTAGYPQNRGNAATLKAKQSISSRIAEILGKAAERAEVTIESLINEAEEIRAAAFAASQFGPALGAVKEKGILAGVRVEKRENLNRSADELTDDELADIIRSGRGNPAQATAGAKVTH